MLFLYKISFRILLFENIWPVTIHSSCSEKHTGVLLSCYYFFISLALGKHQKGVLLYMQVWSPTVEYKLYLLLDEQERKGKHAVVYLLPGLSLINSEVNFGKITTSIYLFFSSGKHITFPSHPKTLFCDTLLNRMSNRQRKQEVFLHKEPECSWTSATTSLTQKTFSGSYCGMTLRNHR